MYKKISLIFLICFFNPTKLYNYVDVTLENKSCSLQSEAIKECEKLEDDPCEEGFYLKPGIGDCKEGKPVCKCTLARLY